MCARLGYRPGSTAQGYDTLTTANTVNQRASLTEKMTDDGWAYQIGARIGRVEATIPRVALAIWSGGSGSGPEELLARTDEFQTGTYMLNEADGTEYIRDLRATTKLNSGKRYGPGWIASDARLGYGYLPHTNVVNNFGTDEITDVWQRTVAAGPTPQDPFGATSSRDNYGWLMVWIDYETNVAPSMPTSTLPAHNSAVGGLTPVFSGNFQDDNETLPNGLPGDSMAQVQIQVRKVLTTTLLWNHTYNASATERANRRFSITYAGTALVTGETYEWRARVSDQFGAWSSYAPSNTSWYEFTVGSGSIDVSAGSPSGKQETQSPGPFTGVWSHSGSLNATSLAVRINDATTGQIVRESGYVTIGGSGTAPGGTLSKTFGSFEPLPWGGSYTYQLRAIDSNGTETDWSGTRAFTTNAVPSIPTLYYPETGMVISTYPELAAFSSDPDDLPGAEHTVTARIKDSSGAVLQSRPMTYSATRGLFLYQTTSADLPTTGNYRWDAYAHDGTVYSSGNTVLGAGSLSTEATFELESGPVIIHTSPAQNATINTDQPLYDWSVTGQVRKRIRVYDASADFQSTLLVFDSGEITSTTTSYRQPAGYLENGGNYFRIIEVWNASNQRGTSIAAYFDVDYGAASTLGGFTASLHRARFDRTHTAILLTWNRTTYTSGQFQSYVITRRADADALFDVDDEVRAENRRIAVITNPSQVTFVDYLPASGVSYTYGISQIVEVNDVAIRSSIERVTAGVEFQDTVICDARQGGARRVVLAAREERNTKYQRNQVVKQPWGSSKPVIFATNTFAREIDGTFYIVADSPADAERTVKEVEKLAFYKGPLCYRDGRGNRYFGDLTDVKRIDPPGGRTQRLAFTFQQTDAHEVIET